MPGSTYSLTAERVDAHLRDVWRGLRDDAGPRAMAGALGAISTLRALGLLSADQAELWETRLDRCPGHEGEGGRVWCAYCGELCRVCGLAYGGAVARCRDAGHCTGCCRLDPEGCDAKEG